MLDKKYPGDTAGGEILAFTVAQWIEFQRELQTVDALANITCQHYKGIRKTGNYRGYWPSRGLAARKGLRRFFFTVTLDNTAWLENAEVIWHLYEQSYDAIPLVGTRNIDNPPTIVLSTAELNDPEFINNRMKGFVESVFAR